MPSTSLIAVAALGLSVSGCAMAGADSTATGPPPTCAATVATTLQGVAQRVYGQAAHGRAVAASSARLAGSTALATAVADDDPSATAAALHPLLRAQIKRIVITRGAHRLADVGRTASVAPVSGVIRDATGAVVGNYTFSVETAAGMARLLHAITGAKVVIGARVPSSPRHVVTSFPAVGYPSGAVRVALLSATAPQSRCGANPDATAANTLGAIGKRLFHAETHSAQTRRVLRIVARDPAFVHAVATGDAAGLRAQIVRFFQDPQLHVVRIRATGAHGRLVNDVGGPYVLAPASAPVLMHGRTIGRVTLSVQDDTGYIKLMHRFTGVGVVLRTPAGVVPGSIAQPAHPAHTVTFMAKRFPTGPLRVSLLIGARP